jgi:hypothetical protein
MEMIEDHRKDGDEPQAIDFRHESATGRDSLKLEQGVVYIGAG